MSERKKMGMADRVQRFRHDYVRALEEERKKIEVFQSELPLSLQLITQEIESAEEQMCEERSVSGDEPVLTEFIPLKPGLASTVEEDVEVGEPAAIGFDAKRDWLRSVKLWNQKMAIAGGITPRSGPLLFKPSTVPIPIYQLWKTNSFNIGQAMIKSVLGSKLICASLRSNDHPRLSYGGDFDNEPFWKTMVKDIAWSLKSVAVFLAEQPSQIKYIEWPTFQSTLRTAMLTLVLVAVLIVALSSVDSCLSYILALLLRRAA